MAVKTGGQVLEVAVRHRQGRSVGAPVNAHRTDDGVHV